MAQRECPEKHFVASEGNKLTFRFHGVARAASATLVCLIFWHSLIYGSMEYSGLVQYVKNPSARERQPLLHEDLQMDLSSSR
jgi:hypothetical protein